MVKPLEDRVPLMLMMEEQRRENDRQHLIQPMHGNKPIPCSTGFPLYLVNRKFLQYASTQRKVLQATTGWSQGTELLMNSIKMC